MRNGWLKEILLFCFLVDCLGLFIHQFSCVALMLIGGFGIGMPIGVSRLFPVLFFRFEKERKIWCCVRKGGGFLR